MAMTIVEVVERIERQGLPFPIFVLDVPWTFPNWLAAIVQVVNYLDDERQYLEGHWAASPELEDVPMATRMARCEEFRWMRIYRIDETTVEIRADREAVRELTLLTDLKSVEISPTTHRVTL